jgi:hypothetical protein
VNITNHPGAGEIFEREALLKTRKPGDHNPFVDPAAFQAWMLELKKAAEEKLVLEKKQAS